jgi:hypothetical protein
LPPGIAAILCVYIHDIRGGKRRHQFFGAMFIRPNTLAILTLNKTFPPSWFWHRESELPEHAKGTYTGDGGDDGNAGSGGDAPVQKEGGQPPASGMDTSG